jgi:thiamine-monophosphate kinase
MKLSRVGELYLLEQIRRTFSRKAKDIIVGIGDDAAVVNPSGKRIVLTTDMMAEGVHFDLRFVTAYQLGFKLISVNVSDIYDGGKSLICSSHYCCLQQNTHGIHI